MNDSSCVDCTAPLSVLMISPQFRPIVGGYEKAAERLSVALAERGHNVTVVTERRKRGWPKKETENRVTIHRVFCISRKGLHGFTSILAYAWFLCRFGNSYDIFHVHQHGFPAALAVVFGRIYRKPVVLKLTGSGERCVFVALRRCRFSSVLIHLHRKIDCFFATSEETKKEIEKFGIPKRKAVVVGNGIDIDEFCPATATKKAELKQDLGLYGKQVVVFAGRIADEKNPIGLLDAWKRVVSQLESAHLLYLGSGSLSRRLNEQVMQQGLEGSVDVLGATDNVVKFFQASDLFVLPSIHEGLSNALLEAMSCGLPVVSTRVSGSMEIFSAADIGEIVEVGDMSTFGQCITRLLQDSQKRRSCGEQARIFVEENYSIGKVATVVEQLYFKLLT